MHCDLPGVTDGSTGRDAHVFYEQRVLVTAHTDVTEIGHTASNVREAHSVLEMVAFPARVALRLE